MVTLVFLVLCNFILYIFILYSLITSFSYKVTYTLPKKKRSYIYIAGCSHVGVIKRGSHTLLNGMKVRVLSNEHIVVLESSPWGLCSLIQPEVDSWLLVMSSKSNFGTWTMLTS